MKLLHKIVEIYASIKGLHELQTKYCHNVCASFSPRIQGTINIKGISVFTILKVRRYHTLILFLSHKKLLSKLALVQVLAWECNILLLHFQITYLCKRIPTAILGLKSCKTIDQRPIFPKCL